MTEAQVVHLDLAGRTAVVTGAGSGIGRACALRLARAGARLVVVDRDEVAAKEVAALTGGSAVIIDLSDPTPLDELDPEIDLVVNNAGIQHVAPLPDFPAERFETIQ